MKTDDAELRGMIALALCKIGQPSIGPLTHAMEHGDDLLKRCAALALWKMGEQGITALVQNVKDEGES
jgi:hypothetical protein